MGKKSQKNMIISTNHIIITNSNEISDILNTFSNSLLKFSLNISREKSQIINYLDGKLLKFKYLGFYFVFVCTKHIKKAVY